jgi:hypothetical protein
MNHLVRQLTITAATLAFAVLPVAAQADVLTAKAADPTEQGAGTMSVAARAAMQRGALPKSADEVAAKAAATRASAEALGPASGGSSAAAGPLATISGGHNFVGQFVTTSTPPDTTGAIGTTRYIQLVNTRFGIYNRSTNALIGSGTLNQLAGLAATVNTFDPQVIWDPQTNRFYYFNDSIFSSSDNRLSWGFSKTSSPNTAADFCHYTTAFGTRFPDYPKLGDSAYFLIVGVNSFAPGFVGSDIIAFSKPAAGTTCPAGSSFKINRTVNIKDSFGNQIFTPVPANQIDTSATGHVVARNGGLPSNRLWFKTVTRHSTGFAVFGAPRAATVATYTAPPDAPGGINSTVFLDTLDARPTQAVQSLNPDRNTFSFWVQHTIAFGSVSAVRWYEINPLPATPVVIRQANIAASPAFLFNAAISSDRRVRTGFTSAFGDNVVVQYSVTRGGASGINPRIVAGSSLSGAALGAFVVLQNSASPYRDFSCGGADTNCRWGDYAGANPDPVTSTTDRGVVWGTNQWSNGTSTAQANWRTKIFALRP